MKSIPLKNPFIVGERTVNELFFDEPTMYQLELFYEALENVEDIEALSNVDANHLIVAALNEITDESCAGKPQLDIEALKRHLKRSEYKACILLIEDCWPDQDDRPASDALSKERGDEVSAEGKKSSAD